MLNKMNIDFVSMLPRKL